MGKKIVIGLAPGSAAWYDDLSKIYLTIAAPYKEVKKGVIVSNIKKGLDKNTILLLEGKREDLDSDDYLDPLKEKKESIKSLFKSGKNKISLFFGKKPGVKKKKDKEDEDEHINDVPIKPEDKEDDSEPSEEKPSKPSKPNKPSKPSKPSEKPSKPNEDKDKDKDKEEEPVLEEPVIEVPKETPEDKEMKEIEKKKEDLLLRVSRVRSVNGIKDMQKEVEEDLDDYKKIGAVSEINSTIDKKAYSILYKEISKSEKVEELEDLKKEADLIVMNLKDNEALKEKADLRISDLKDIENEK